MSRLYPIIFIIISNTCWSLGITEIQISQLLIQVTPGNSQYWPNGEHNIVGIWGKGQELRWDTEGFYLIPPEGGKIIKRFNYIDMGLKLTSRDKYSNQELIEQPRVIGRTIVFTVLNEEFPIDSNTYSFTPGEESSQEKAKLITGPPQLTQHFGDNKLRVFIPYGQTDMGYWGFAEECDIYHKNWDPTEIVVTRFSRVVQLDKKGDVYYDISDIIENLRGVSDFKPQPLHQGTLPWAEFIYQPKDGVNILKAIDPRNGTVREIEFPKEILNKNPLNIFEPDWGSITDGFFLKDGRLVLARISDYGMGHWTEAYWFLIDQGKPYRISDFKKAYPFQMNTVHQE